MTSDQRVLVVDDDDAIRALLSTVLRRRGLRVDTARNGVEALEHLGAHPYALVVLDLMMPRMSGYDLLEHLSAASVLTRPRVLVLTAGMDTRLLTTGPDAADLIIGMVHKPFDIEMLVDAVMSYLAAGDGTQATPTPTAELTTLN